MRITICGSSTFRIDMVEFKKRLTGLGHEAIVHPVYEELVAGRNPELAERIKHEHANVKREGDFIRWYYNSIVGSDAILVLNFDKNGIQNYVGGNTLMEMGYAHVHDKKIFLLNPVPNISYSDEIFAMDPVILNGNLKRIGVEA